MSPEGPKSNGTSRTNRHEMPEPAEMSTKGPNQMGHPGQMEAKYAKEPKEPKTNQKLLRVLTREKSKSQW
ncbi:hypothetical protein KI387_034946, partial [Taxus chinensis]